jgi:hypothetical protein
MLALLCCNVAAPEDADRVLLLRGLGDGRFADPRVLFFAPHHPDPAGEIPAPAEIVAGDFDGNGAADVAWMDPETEELVVLVAKPSGSFALETSPLPPLTRRLTSADFEPDGRHDLVAHRTSERGITLLLSRGDGTFRAGEDHQLEGLRSLFFADVDADGAHDMISAGDGPSGTRIVTLTGDGAGRFQDPTIHDIYGHFSAIPANLNSDLAIDLVLPTLPTGFWMMMNSGDGRFDSPQPANDRFGRDCFHIADVDGDGLDDAIGSPGATVLLNLGGGRFDERSSYDAASPQPCGPVLDLDGDGLPDFVRLDELTLRVLLADGEGGYDAPIVLDLNVTPSSEVTSWAGADVDGNGHGDVLLHTRAIADEESEDSGS